MQMNQRNSRSFIGVQSAALRESWQGDLNDNVNCLLLQYFSTGTDFLSCSRSLLIKAAHHLNNLPRETLEFETWWSGVTAVLRRPIEITHTM
jgi:IS30 family transposase